jgi:hypothetical protein
MSWEQSLMLKYCLFVRWSTVVSDGEHNKLLHNEGSLIALFCQYHRLLGLKDYTGYESRF